MNSATVTKLQDYNKPIGESFSIRVCRNKRTLSLLFPANFLGMTIQIKYKNGKVYITNNKAKEGVKVTASKTGGNTYYKATFSAKKWVPDMPRLAGRLTAHKQKDGSFKVAVKEVFKASKKKIKPKAKRQKQQRQSKETVAGSVQNLNRFMASKSGKGYRYDVQQNGQLRIIKEDVIE